MTSRGLEESPYLLRFPWDWPPGAWDIARLLVDRWEHGTGEFELVALDADYVADDVPGDLKLDGPFLSDVLAVKELLATCAVEHELPPPRDAFSQNPELASWVEAVAACLRGNWLWNRAQSLVDAQQEPRPIIQPTGLAQGPLFASRESRREMLIRAAAEYKAAAELVPGDSLCVCVAAAEILLLDGELAEAALGAYGFWLGEGPTWRATYGRMTDDAGEQIGVSLADDCLKLASLFLARAGLRAPDHRMPVPRSIMLAAIFGNESNETIQQSLGADHGFEEPDKCGWDAEGGLHLWGDYGQQSWDYPLHHPVLPTGEEWHRMWMDIARVILESCFVQLWFWDDELDKVDLPGLLGRGVYPVDEDAMAGLLKGLAILEREGVQTRLHGAFAGAGPTGIDQVLKAVDELRQETVHQHHLTRQRQWASAEEIKASLSSLQDSLASAVDSLDRVARSVALLKPELHSDARSHLERHLGLTWSRLADETQDYLSNAQAIWVMNLKNPGEWDWGLCTIELAKALEDVLRRLVGALAVDRSGYRGPIYVWFATQRPGQPPQPNRMNIGDVAAFLQWAAENPNERRFIQGRLRDAPDGRFLFEDLPALLSKLNRYRNSAAHAGGSVKERQAAEMYQTLMGTGDNECLLARLVSLSAAG